MPRFPKTSTKSFRASQLATVSERARQNDVELTRKKVIRYADLVEEWTDVVMAKTEE